MELSKEEELIALASALYLVGMEVEASREKLEALCEQGIRLTDPQMIRAKEGLDHLALEFERLERQYRQITGEI